MKIQYAQPGMILNHDILDSNGNLLLEKGIRLTSSYLQRLQKFQITHISVEDPIADQLTVPAIAPTLRQEVFQCFRGLLNLPSQNLSSADMRDILNQKLDPLLDHLIEQAHSHLPHICNVHLRKMTANEIQHTLNVTLLCITTGLHMHLSKSMLHDLAKGALFHDLSLLMVPADNRVSYIHQPDQYYAHPLTSGKLLEKMGCNLTVIRSAREHHECPDGSGFPAKLRNGHIHPFARMIKIANYFDSSLMLSISTGTPRHDLMESMLAVGGTLFDNNLLHAFFRVVTLYPPGTLVCLNTGEIAHVIKNHPQHPQQPCIRLLNTEKEIDLLTHPELSILDAFDSKLPHD